MQDGNQNKGLSDKFKIRFTKWIYRAILAIMHFCDVFYSEI